MLFIVLSLMQSSLRSLECLSVVWCLYMLAPSLTTFRTRLKTFLLTEYLAYLTFLCLQTVYCGPAQCFKYLGHSKNS